jgi:outer membrane murein-binding lipoprotein Lpp
MFNKKIRIFSVVLASLVLVLSFAGCGGSSAMDELALDTNAISNTLEAIKSDISDIEEANHVIHVETDTILEGEVVLPDEVAGSVETAHMSSHAVLLLLPYIETAINELEAYKSNPEANRGKILIAIGKVEVLGKVAGAAAGSTKWTSLMEWPVTDETPHALVHGLADESSIQDVAEYKEAAEKLHTAMHGIEDAVSSLELDVELFIDMIKTAGVVE